MIPSFNNNCNTCVYRMYSSMYVYLGENINENEEEDKGFIEQQVLSNRGESG